MNIYLICPERFNYPACRIADYRKMEAFPLFVNTLARFGSYRYFIFSLGPINLGFASYIKYWPSPAKYPHGILMNNAAYSSLVGVKFRGSGCIIAARSPPLSGLGAAGQMS
jgi:hypothetical protein